MKFEFHLVSIYVVIQQYTHLSSLTRLQLWMPTTATFQHLVDENVSNNLIQTICLIDLIQGQMCHLPTQTSQSRHCIPDNLAPADSRCIFPHPPCPAACKQQPFWFFFGDSNFPFLPKNKYSFGALEGFFHYQDPHPCLLVCPQYLLDCWFVGSQSKLCDMDLWYIAWLGSIHIRLFKQLQQTQQMLTIPKALLKQNFSQLKNGSDLQGQLVWLCKPTPDI